MLLLAATVTKAAPNMKQQPGCPPPPPAHKINQLPPQPQPPALQVKSVRTCCTRTASQTYHRHRVRHQGKNNNTVIYKGVVLIESLCRTAAVHDRQHYEQ